MDDYIFLIIAIAISIIGAIRSGKKKENKFQTEVVPKKNADDFPFPEWLAGDLPEEEPEDIEPPRPKKTVEYKEPVIPQSTLYRPQNYHARFKSSLPERHLKQNLTVMKIQDENESEEQPEEQNREAYLENFSARKAIIYSEILNPKYLS